MKLHKLASIVCAIVLQIMPICRVALVNPAGTHSGCAIVVRCLAAVVAMLGAVDAVSGASATIVGVQKYPISPLNPITTNATAAVGSLFAYRIIVDGALQDTNYAYYGASPLPPGLTINTNLGGDGFILGTGTVAGVTFPVTLTAGNKLYDDLGGAPVHLDIIITLTNASGAVKPSILNQPQSRTVTNGGLASFSVTASGSPTPTYRWRKDGTVISGATATTYSIPAATTNDAGGYSVIVSNSAGSVTSVVATLTVLEPPRITAQPQNRTALLGGSATFAVAAAGTAPLSYQWRRGTTSLSGELAAALTLSAVTLADAGEYSVAITNSAGGIVSQPASLRVIGPPTLSGPSLADGAIRFSFTQEADAVYTVVYRDTLDAGPWLVLTNLLSITAPATATIGDQAGPTNRFYRIEVRMP